MSSNKGGKNIQVDDISSQLSLITNFCQDINSKISDISKRCDNLESNRPEPQDNSANSKSILLKRVTIRDDTNENSPDKAPPKKRMKLRSNPGVCLNDSAPSGSGLTDKAGPSKAKPVTISEALNCSYSQDRESSMDDNDDPTVDLGRQNEAEILEKSLLEEISSSDANADSESSSSGEEEEIPIKGLKKHCTWEPPSKAFKWFKKVADIELSEEELNNLGERFTPSEDIADHFNPPKLPSIIWNKLKGSNQNSSEVLKQKTIFRSQRMLNTALMPLLTVLDSLNKDDPNQELLASSIQVLCSTNLQLSRFRRATISKFVKPEMRQALFSQTVNHQHLFGRDFNDSAEQAAKEQSSFHKVLAVSKYPPRIRKPISHENNNDPTPINTTSSYSDKKFDRGERPPKNDNSSQSKGPQRPFRTQGRARGYHRRGNFRPRN